VDPRVPSCVSEFAAYLYYKALRALPVLVRQWWLDDCSRNAAQLIEKYF
jgi:hypothetical protein